MKDKNGAKEPLKRFENTLEKHAINNNLVWDCTTDTQEWFFVTAKIIQSLDGLEQPVCVVRLVEPT